MKVKYYLSKITIAAISQILICLIFFSTIIAAEGDSLWSHTYGTSAQETALSLIETNDGGFLLSGTSPNGMLLVKTDSNGDSLWSRNYNWALIPRCSIALANDHYIVAGGVIPGNAFLAELDVNGDSLWVMFYDLFWINSMIKIDDGYILAGVYFSTWPNPYGNMGLIKTDFGGNTIWWQYYGGYRVRGGAASVLQTDDGGYLLSGWGYPFGNIENDIYVVKTDADGNAQWSYDYRTSLYETAWTALKVSDGYLLGGGIGDSVLSGDMLLMKISLNGDSMWTRTYGSSEPGGEEITAILDAGNDQYLLAGQSASNLGDMRLIKINSMGDSIWSYTYGGDSVDAVYSSIISSDNCLMAGFTQSFGAGDLDMWLLCVEGPFLGVMPQVPEPYLYSFDLHPPHPNPFNPSTSLSYQLQAASFVSLKVYDTAGRLVARLVEEWREAGTHEVTFDGSSLSSGIYLAKMTAGEFTAVQKLVLLK